MENTKKILVHYLKQVRVNDEQIWGNNTTYSLIHHLFIKINKQCKFNKKVSPHTFRRTRAVHLLDKGVNVLYIQELLGHNSISTTQEYAKVKEKSKFEAIKKATPNIKTEYLEDWNDDQDLLNQLLNL